MKILIVEDIKSKRDSIKKVLSEAVPDCEIHIAKSFLSASSLLEQVDFELLVLDLVLPLRDDGVPSQDSGIDLLTEIFEGINLKSPNHIICISAHKEAIEKLGDATRTHLVHCIEYLESDTGWACSLASKAVYALKRVRSTNTFPQDFDIDIGIITSYPSVELAAILELGKQLGGEFHKLDELHYYRAEWSGKYQNLNVVACCAPSMGMTAACVTASKLINRFRPKYLVMTGIAAATSKNLALGDVIVADTCFDYGSGKILDLDDGSRKFIPSPKQLTISARLMALLQPWAASQIGMIELGRSWSKDGKFVPKLEIGIMTTGAAVVQSETLVADLLASSRKVIGLEMEAYGVFQAAKLSSLPKPEVLVAKSVCDFADREKGDDAHSLAAFTSAGFVYNFFTSEPDIYPTC
jgi:nucleoside phosphorylase/CheY-like chemotaxis protein